jgi:hypothetical protein
MKTFKVARSTRLGMDVTSKGSLGHQGHKRYHQKSTVGCSQTTMMASHIERCSRVETIHMKLC